MSRSDAVALKNESKQQVNCEANCGEAVLDNQTATSERVPSGGPALTSDGGDRSSVGSSGSSFPEITQHSSSSAIASSSDECIESMDLVCINKRKVNNNSQTTSNSEQCKRPAVVGVHIAGGSDMDLFAPGYSVIQKRPNKVGIADSNSSRKSETTEACLCQPYGQQQVQPADETKTTSDKAAFMEHHETRSKVKALKSPSSQLEQQQPVNGGNQTGESKTTTSKLRQLLHLESRAKSGVKLNGQRNIKATIKTSTTLNESEEDNEINLNNVDSAKEKETENESSQTNNKLPLTAIAGGYYAYSPVVQSASELKCQSNNGVPKSSKAQQQENKSSNGNKSSGKKNWLMSKFSMSSNNLNNNSQSIQESSSIGSKQNLMLDNVKVKSIANKLESATDGASIDSSALLGPERKAELININGSDLRDNNNKSLNNGAELQGFLSSPASHDDNASSSSSLHLIRPKSAFSTTSADLIAAQKSLAAAAAEKVKRDRMVKLCSNNNINSNFINNNNKEHLTTLQNDDGLTTSKESVLTVKTSDPFWSSVVNQPIVVAQNGINHQNYLIGQHQLVNHRSGANSVGMSDSSPSNNGAESDNSIQTTTGSANTDTTSGAGVNGIISRGHSSHLTTATNNNNNKNQCSSLDQNSTSSPLGILSRILLNNKSFGYRTTTNNKDNDALAARNSIDSAFNKQKGSPFMQMPNGSLSSSSVLSSPSSNNHSPSATITSSNGTATDNRTSQQKLDQLTSRSRCPIVLTKSNGLPSETEEEEEKKGRGEKEEIKEENNSSEWKDINESLPGVRDSTAPPPLPAKGVLKMPSSRTLIQNNYNSRSAAASNGVVPLIQPESMNGLPRVASYTQISSSLDQCPPSFKQPFYGNNHPSKDNSKQLCSYHLLNQRNNPVSSQLMRAQYGPYSNGATTGPQNNGYCQEFIKNKDRYHMNPLVAPSHHHMSHNDLRSTIDTASPFADLTASSPASAAINYEYYLENSPFFQHTINNGKGINHPNSQSHYTTANDNSIYLNYAHEDSIYIPEYMMATTKNLNKIRDIPNGSTGVNELTGNDLMSKQKNNFFDQHQKHLLITSRPRPKSSLDTPFLSSSSAVVNQHYPSSPISTTNNGRQFSANKTSPAISVNSQQHSHRLLSSSSTSESQNSPSGVANQSTLNHHNINHYQEQYEQQLPTYYSYSSPYRNPHNLSAYLYSENSIYASDQSVAFNRSSDLTVLPTVAADTDKVYSSSNINDPKQASSAEASLTSGGCNKNGANIMVTCSTSSNNTQCPSSPASNQSDRSRTPKAQQQQQAVGGNSWMPNQPYKSLIQIRQLSSAKSNQSPSVGENTGQHFSSSGLANFQLSTSEVEKEPKTKETDPGSSSNSKAPTKVFISNRAQSNEFKDKNNSSSTIQVFHEDLNTSTVL